MKHAIIACEVIREELLRAIDTPVHCEFIGMSLHLHPEALRRELQARIERLHDHSPIVLGFGLCGAATLGLISRHTSLVIPNVADCIPLLLGSVERQLALHRQEPGTFYTTSGWLEGERSLPNERGRLVSRYGERIGTRMLRRMFDSYRRLLFMYTDHPRNAANLPTARQLADALELEFATTHADPEWIRRLARGPWDPPEFLSFPPNVPISNMPFDAATPPASAPRPVAAVVAGTTH